MDKLYRGIFWIKNIEVFDFMVIKSQCNKEGLFIEIPDAELLAKSGKEFNHQAAWKTLSKAETENKPFNYFPRGRVEIRNGKAIIFANANIVGEKLKLWAIAEFGLTKENGIETVVLKTDMSEHYLCYLDKEE